MDKNSVENTNFIVSSEFQKTRLDVFIFHMCDFLPSRSYAAKLIKNGIVLVNEKIRKSSFFLRLADVVSIDLSALQNLHDMYKPPKAEFMPLDILYEDSHIIVIHKPAGLVVHPGAGVPDGTLVNGLLAYYESRGEISDPLKMPTSGHLSRVGIVHRLDRDTSGVMVVAKTQLALTKLSQQFAEHAHRRVYHAVCYGEFEKKEDSVETGYGRDPRNRLKFKVLPVGEGKRAALKYKVLKELSEGLFSFVECTLETGRTHQIRVQMTHLKHGIVGDVLYSQVSNKVQNNLKMLTFVRQHAKRQLLHAYVLEITHPQTLERMIFQAPYPKDFEKWQSL